jgi:hypothetical protein
LPVAPELAMPPASPMLSVAPEPEARMKVPVPLTTLVPVSSFPVTFSVPLTVISLLRVTPAVLPTAKVELAPVERVPLPLIVWVEVPFRLTVAAEPGLKFRVQLTVILPLMA